MLTYCSFLRNKETWLNEENFGVEKVKLKLMKYLSNMYKYIFTNDSGLYTAPSLDQGKRDHKRVNSFSAKREYQIH